MKPLWFVLGCFALLALLDSCVTLQNDPVVPRLEATRVSMENYLDKDQLGNGISAWIKAKNTTGMEADFLRDYAGGLEKLLDRRVAAAASPAFSQVLVKHVRNRQVFGLYQGEIPSSGPMRAAQLAWYRQLREKGFHQVALIYALANPALLRGTDGLATELLSLAGALPNHWAERRIRELAGLPAVAPAPEPAIDPAGILQACATVWVDRGIKFEKGLGSADIVIGSAFFIEKDGYLLTNHHVIASEVDPDYEGYSRLYIRMGGANQERIPATVVAWDASFDLALLKVSVDAPAIVPLTDLDTVRSGTSVLAFGSPGGLDNSVTSGIISNIDRRLLELGDVMQIDAAVNPGNSGGPLFAASGDFIGIVFAGIPQFQGVNFSVPAYWIADLLPRLAAGGELRHPWLGVKLFEYRKQVRVLYVVPGSPAWDIGLAAGDALDSVDGVEITTIAQAYRLLGKLGPDDLVRFSWHAGTGNLTDSVRPGPGFDGLCLLAERPRHPLEAAVRSGLSLTLLPPLFGFVAQDISASPLAVDLKIEQVIPGTMSDETGLSIGDTLRIIDWVYDAKQRALYFIFETARRSQGFLPQTLQLATSIDTEDFM